MNKTKQAIEQSERLLNEMQTATKADNYTIQQLESDVLAYWSQYEQVLKSKLETYKKGIDSTDRIYSGLADIANGLKREWVRLIDKLPK